MDMNFFKITDSAILGQSSGVIGLSVYVFMPGYTSLNPAYSDWRTSVEYNVKNRMGGYVGLTQHNYMPHYGKLTFADGLFTENLSCDR